MNTARLTRAQLLALARYESRGCSLTHYRTLSKLGLASQLYTTRTEAWGRATGQTLSVGVVTELGRAVLTWHDMALEELDPI
jgi:hypothetical protein